MPQTFIEWCFLAVLLSMCVRMLAWRENIVLQSAAAAMLCICWVYLPGIVAQLLVVYVAAECASYISHMVQR